MPISEFFRAFHSKKKKIQIFVEPKTSKDQELILRFQCGKRGIISDVLKGDDFKTEVQQETTPRVLISQRVRELLFVLD